MGFFRAVTLQTDRMKNMLWLPALLYPAMGYASNLDDLPPLFWALLLCVGVIGATLSYLHEKRHPFFKPTPDSPPQPPMSPWQLIRPIVMWCLKAVIWCLSAVLALTAFVLVVFGFVKLIKWAWYF